MDNQASTSSTKPISPVEMFVNEHYLNELQETKFKIMSKHSIKEFQDLKEERHKERV